MADEDTVVDEKVVDDEGVDQPKEVDPDKELESEGADKETEDTDTGEDTDIEPDDIPVRSSAQHIIARKNRQIEKLKSKTEKVGPVDVELGDDDDLTPEAQKAMDKRINARISPLIDTIVGEADSKELDKLFSENPEAKKYEKRIKAYMKHDAYKAVPPSAIYHHLAFEAAANAGAKKKAVADKEAEQLGGAGSSHRSKGGGSKANPSVQEIENMSEEEFNAYTNEVKGIR